MGQGQSGLPGSGGGGNRGDRNGKNPKKKYEQPPAPQRIGKKKKKRGFEAASKIPTVTPSAKCRLRLLKLERIKDYMLLEEEFVTNQEKFEPHEEKTEEERSRVRPSFHAALYSLVDLDLFALTWSAQRRWRVELDRDTSRYVNSDLWIALLFGKPRWRI